MYVFHLSCVAQVIDILTSVRGSRNVANIPHACARGCCSLVRLWSDPLLLTLSEVYGLEKKRCHVHGYLRNGCVMKNKMNIIVVCVL